MEVAASQQVALVAYAPQATLFNTAPISGLAQTISVPALRYSRPDGLSLLGAVCRMRQAASNTSAGAG